MDNRLGINREYYAGALIILIGGFAIIVGRDYEFGTLVAMGPGFFPVMLGAVLIAVGVAIAIGGTTEAGAARTDDLIYWPDPRGALCIISGVVAFILLGEHGGLVPATFASVFISALGDRTGSPKQALFLAVSITVVGVLVFSYGLQVQLPLFTF